MTPTTAARLQDPTLEGVGSLSQGLEATTARAWLEDRLRAAMRPTDRIDAVGDPRLRVWTMPAPLGEPEALLEAPSPYGVFWHPPAGPALAGVGVAHRLTLDTSAPMGPERLTGLRRQAETLWGRLEVDACDGMDTPAPRLFGGVAFAPGAAQADPWREFGEGCFTLPRWTYTRDDTTATLTLAVAATELAAPGASEALLAELDQWMQRLESPPRPSPATPRVLEIHKAPRSEFEAQVEAIRDAIATGEVAKVVAARSSRVVLADALDPADVLRRLRRGLRASVRFALTRPQTTFLGATPERLISRRGRRIQTEALAGSIASGGEHAAELLGSPKDGREHQLVVDEIVRCLRPLCDQFDIPGEPRIRELRDVLHLHTPVQGHLAKPHHVLDLVARLHPTPAVGGVPTPAAVDWIQRHEPEARGWYAAPVGWFDAAGDGDFAVALRSCVLRDREAFLFAGAGIVRDSDPRLEVKETELKRQALLTALGA